VDKEKLAAGEYAPGMRELRALMHGEGGGNLGGALRKVFETAERTGGTQAVRDMVSDLEAFGTRDRPAPEAPASAVRDAAEQAAIRVSGRERARSKVFDFLEHAQKMGAEVREFDTGDKTTLGDVNHTMERIAENTDHLEEFMGQG
jgi:hypothetical protein